MQTEVIDTRQTGDGRAAKLALMDVRIEILAVEKDGPDGVLVTFSDGTVGGYVVEELLELRPYREPANAEPGRPGGAVKS